MNTWMLLQGTSEGRSTSPIRTRMGDSLAICADPVEAP
jgi:hypothetical protein